MFCTALDYSKCPKNLYTKVSDSMADANSVDPDQTVPEGTTKFRPKKYGKKCSKF